MDRGLYPEIEVTTSWMELFLMRFLLDKMLIDGLEYC